MRAIAILRSSTLLGVLAATTVAAQHPPLVDARVVWTAADDPSAILSRSARFAVDQAGNLFYPEVNESTIYVFDSLGKYVASIGRKGGGPGEFQGVCCAAIDTKGRLWARDMGGGRYNVFSLKTPQRPQLAFQVKMAHTDRNLWISPQFNRQGWLYDLTSTTRSGNPPQRGFDRLLVDTTGVVRAKQVLTSPTDVTKPYTVTSTTGGSTNTRYFYSPYRTMALRADGPMGDMAQANSGHYAITWMKDDQSVRHQITRAINGPVLASAERKRAEDELRAIATEARVDLASLPFTVPERKPALRALEFDLDGRLWVERYVAMGTPRETDVYDQRGKLAFTVVWPALRGITFTGAARGNDVWVVTENADDVPRIVKLRLTPRP